MSSSSLRAFWDRSSRRTRIVIVAGSLLFVALLYPAFVLLFADGTPPARPRSDPKLPPTTPPTLHPRAEPK
jgi:hypothetical protein